MLYQVLLAASADTPQGGHFAALERPQDYLDDLTAFCEQVWAGRK